MFEKLKQFKRVYVTGPQRSGTTICTKMISQDTGFDSIDERQYRQDKNHFDALRGRKEIVIQCPKYNHIIHEHSDSQSIIVMMMRPVKEIIQSQIRVNWQHEKHELSKYNVKDGPIAKVKYDFWEKQKRLIEHYLEIEYRSLEAHPLWIDDKLRRYFKIKQTKIQQI